MDYDYPTMVPPFPLKAFGEMTPPEAQQHFEWFVEQIPSRLNVLRSAIKATTGDASWLDGAPGSLIPLWVWAMQFFEASEMSETERLTLTNSQPEWLKQRPQDFRILTSLTQCLVLDIGIYLAEVFRHQYQQVHWALWKRKSHPINQPILSGFKMPFKPSDPVQANAWRVIRGDHDPSALFKMYEVWRGYLKEI